MAGTISVLMELKSLRNHWLEPVVHEASFRRNSVTAFVANGAGPPPRANSLRSRGHTDPMGFFACLLGGQADCESVKKGIHRQIPSTVDAFLTGAENAAEFSRD
jgi:hypothetical protein